MRKMKKFMSLLLAAVMVLSVMTVNVFAEGKGTITVENATVGKDYAVYKMFSMTKTDDDAYAYIVENKWEGFFTGEYADLIDSKGQAVAEKFKEINLTTFAGLAAEYAEAHNVPTVGAENDVDDTTLEFGGLEMGYYLVTSTFSGGLCMLTNAEPDATIVDKNFLPAIAKGVDEDDDNEGFVLNNDAYIGQNVDFQIVVTSDAAPKNYVVTDTLQDGKWDTTDTEDSVVVKHVTHDDTATTTLIEGTHYTVDVEDNVLTVEFVDAALTDVKAYDELVITYTAKLAGTAAVSNEGTKVANTNIAELDYKNQATGESGTRESEETNTYTWEIPVFKYETVNGGEKALKGAKFVLQLDEEENNDEEAYYKIENGVVSWVTDIADATKLESDDEGYLVFTGVDTGDYVLVETEAPDGYNMAPDTEFTTTLEITVEDGVVYNDGNLKVENKTGLELPGTGGIGTTIFRVGGAVLIIVAGALLVAKKRTNNI